MRFLTRRIYRAFPELDRFPDEACDRFVRAARRGFTRTLLRSLILFAVALPLLALGVYAANLSAAVAERVSPSNPVRYALALLLWALLSALCLAPSLIVPLFVRDRLLRRRVRYVIRARGTCASCGYSLLGVPVPDSLTVVCPECSFTSQADPSLNELVDSGSGQRVFSPAPELKKPPRIFTPKRVHTLKRAALWSAIALVFAAPAAWGLYAWFLREQAALAASERVYSEGLNAFIESRQPKDAPPGSPDAFDAFNAALKALDAVDDNTWRATPIKTSAGDVISPDFSSIWSPPDPVTEADLSDRQREARSAQLDLSLKLIEQYRQGGVYDALRTLQGCRRAVRGTSCPHSQPLFNMPLDYLGRARNLARIESARITLALKAGDVKEYEDALTGTLAISRAMSHQASLIESLVAIAIESLAHERIRAVLAARPGPEWVEATQRALASQAPTVPRGHALDGERLVALDSVAWVFEDPARVRWGRLSPGISNLSVNSGFPRALGTYRQNKREINDLLDAQIALMKAERWERAALPQPPDPDQSRYQLPALFAPAYARTTNSVDMLDLDRRGTAVLIALERFRAARHALPNTLAELVPDFLPAPPLDPWSGKPLGYHRIDDPAADPFHRDYLVYSVANDGHDNAGAEKPGRSAPFEILNHEYKAKDPEFDFIINDPRR